MQKVNFIFLRISATVSAAQFKHFWRRFAKLQNAILSSAILGDFQPAERRKERNANKVER